MKVYSNTLRLAAKRGEVVRKMTGSARRNAHARIFN